MHKDLPKPKKGAVFYEDKRLYAALANHPITRGHVVIVWKEKVADLHLLRKKDYEHLMNVVDAVRDAMLKTLKIRKVYLIYMDEAKHVHWHLVPRYSKKGMKILKEKPKKLKDTELGNKFKENISATKFYVIRHPQTELNKKSILQGHKDSPLTDLGKKYAVKIAKKLANKDISKIYTSDLGRCVQTSKIISQIIKAPTIKRRGLRERNFGILNGKPNKTVKKSIDLSNPELRPINGESFNDMKRRVLKFIKSFRNNKKKEPHLIVTHEGCIRAILSDLYNTSFTSKRCNSTQQTILELDVLGGSIYFADRMN